MQARADILITHIRNPLTEVSGFCLLLYLYFCLRVPLYSVNRAVE
jgi:hypothetical protein